MDRTQRLILLHSIDVLGELEKNIRALNDELPNEVREATQRIPELLCDVHVLEGHLQAILLISRVTRGLEGVTT